MFELRASLRLSEGLGVALREAVTISLFHCDRVEGPVMFQLVCERPCQAIEPREERGIANVHCVQLRHCVSSNQVRGKNKLYYAVCWNKCFDWFMKNARHDEGSTLRK